MPGDPLARVNPGDKLPTSARTWNALLTAAAKVEGRTPGVLGRGAPAVSRGVLVHNGTGSDVPLRGVVGIDEPLFTPTDDSEADFLRGDFAFEGAAPAWADHRGRFGIALEPLPDGAMRRVAVEGLVRVMVDFGSEGPMPRADIIPSDTAKLRAGTTGAAEILWADGTSGEKWCVCRLGGIATSRVYARIHTPAPDGSNKWTYQATIGAFGADGAWADGAVTVMARNLKETRNTGTGVEGSGIDEDGLAGTFTHVSVGEIIAAIEGPYDIGATPFFYFDSANQPDGACAE